jgi:hypothetical protein
MYFTGVNPNFQTGLVFGGKVILIVHPDSHNMTMIKGELE